MPSVLIWREEMEKNQRAVELTQQMVRIDSSNPGAGERGMERFLLSFAEELSSRNDRVTVQTEEVMPGRSNVMLCLPGKAE